MPGPSTVSSPPGSITSDVKETHVLRVLLDEVAAALDVFAHQGREDLVGGGRVVHGDLQQGAGLGVHRGLPELLVVHLAEALVPLDSVLLRDSPSLRGAVADE